MLHLLNVGFVALAAREVRCSGSSVRARRGQLNTACGNPYFENAGDGLLMRRIGALRRGEYVRGGRTMTEKVDTVREICSCLLVIHVLQE